MKLSILYEKNLDPNIVRHLTRPLPDNQEIAWVDNQTPQQGGKKQTSFTYDKDDPNIKDQFVYHNHPTRGKKPQIINTFPSKKDLESAKQLKSHGAKGIGIFNDHEYYISLVPKDDSQVNQHKVKEYKKAVKQNKPEAAIENLEDLGFDIELGEI